MNAKQKMAEAKIKVKGFNILPLTGAVEGCRFGVKTYHGLFRRYKTKEEATEYGKSLGLSLDRDYTIPPEAKKIAAEVIKFMDDNKDYIGHLYSRWQDEFGYENINDYVTALQGKASPYSIKIISCAKRPMKFDLNFNGSRYSLLVKSAGGSNISLEIIA